jgi:hypothetical protein
LGVTRNTVYRQQECMGFALRAWQIANRLMEELRMLQVAD